MPLKSQPTKPATAHKPEKPHREALMSSAELYRATGYGQSAIAEQVAIGLISPVSRGLWPAIATLGAMVRRLRERDAGSEDRQRKNRAEANLAEMEAARIEGTLVLRSDYLNNYADAIAQGVSRISRLKSLTDKQKADVFAALRSVSLPELAASPADDADASNGISGEPRIVNNTRGSRRSRPDP